MGRYDKYFREEPNAKANAQPIKKEPKAKPVTTSRATKVAAPKIKRKNYRKSALRWNGILIFINVCFMLTGIELIALKLLKNILIWILIKFSPNELAPKMLRNLSLAQLSLVLSIFYY